MQQQSLSQKIKVKHSFVKVSAGLGSSPTRLALLKMESPQKGPTLWLTGCIHGDEVGGIAIIQKVFKKLQKQGLLKGSVYAFPLANPSGFEVSLREVTPSGEDLNRSFPGNKNGTPAKRTAAVMFTSISKTNPTLVLDLNNDWINSIPYTVVDPDPGAKHKDAYNKTEEYSKKTGFVVIAEEKEEANNQELQKSLTRSLLTKNIPALTLEVGGAYTVNDTEVEKGINSIFNILSYLGMIKPQKEFWDSSITNQPSLENKILQYCEQPTCSKSGIIRFIVKSGQIVKRGQPLAKIYNKRGELQETLQAQSSCIILGHSDSSAAKPGLAVIASGIIPLK